MRQGDSTLHYGRVVNSPELSRAPQSTPEHTRAPRSSPELSRAPQSSPEHPRAPQRSPEVPRGPQSSPEIPRAPRSSPELPRGPRTQYTFTTPFGNMIPRSWGHLGPFCVFLGGSNECVSLRRSVMCIVLIQITQHGEHCLIKHNLFREEARLRPPLISGGRNYLPPKTRFSQPPFFMVDQCIVQVSKNY